MVVKAEHRALGFERPRALARRVFGGALVALGLCAGCGLSRSAEPEEASGGEGAAMIIPPIDLGGSGGKGGAAGAAGLPTIPPSNCDDPSGAWFLCRGGAFYCERADCIGIAECDELNSDCVPCTCRWRLPGASDAGVSPLPPAPSGYPGAGCPVDPQMHGGCGCWLPQVCVYETGVVCCSDKSYEDCGKMYHFFDGPDATCPYGAGQ